MARPESNESVNDATTGARVAWQPSLPRRAAPRAPQRIELDGYRDFVPVARTPVSEVYRAVQEGVDRPVAVKVLLLDDAEAVARFQRELDITVQLGRQHPHIVNVIDTGLSRTGQPCIVMEYYDAGSLHDRLVARGPLPAGEVLAAGIAVADALAFAHAQGVLHRDVKPQNILVLPTSYVVADFGIARRIDSARTTSADWFSFRHAAPQVLDGEPPSVFDDIWSLGSTLYTLLDGRSPFAVDNPEEDTALAYMRRVRTSRPRPLERTDVPPGLLAVIDRCLRYDPAQRFGSADALLGTLRDLAAERRAWAPGADPAAVRTGPPPRSETPGAAPPALAVSALMHLPSSKEAAAATDVPTGTGPRPTGLELEPIGAPSTGGLRRRVLAIVAAGVLAGAALAVGAVLLRDRPSQNGPVLPTLGASGLPSDVATRQNNPAIAPVITHVEADGASAFLQWDDPTDGDASFLVVLVTDGGAGRAALDNPEPGSTQLLLETLPSGITPPYCFQIYAFAGDEVGVSTQACAG